MLLINCPVCGKRIPAASKQCPECGFKISEYLNNEQNSHKQKKRICKRIGIAVGVILLLGIFGKKQKAPAPAVSASSNTIEEGLSLEETSGSIKESSAAESAAAVQGKVSGVGVYAGDDHDILILKADGLASYYCSSQEYTELNLPWSSTDNKISIPLKKLHCVITANLSAENTELIFRSDSRNWNSEIFKKLSVGFLWILPVTP